MPDAIPFHNRAHEVSRIEAFSDVVFGFAMSLLVVSLEVPKTYAQLLETLRGVFPFAFCFFIFITIWFEHHRLFKRYALHDVTMLALNTILLFVLLVYVYPLKYMATAAMTRHHADVPPDQYPVLFTIYGIGFTAVFWLLAAMFWHAYRQRAALHLNEVERIDTLERVYDNVFMGSFGLISAAVAHTAAAQLAGIVYFLIAIPKTIVPWVMGVKRNNAERAMLAAASTPKLPRPSAPKESPAH